MAPRIQLALVTLLAAGIASAADRVAVMPFLGPRGNIPRDQIVTSVCAQIDCVPQAKVNRRGRPDWSRVRRYRVELLIVGKVEGPARKRTLLVEGYDRRGRRQWRTNLDLARNGKLSRSTLEEITERIVGKKEREPEKPPEVAPREREEDEKPALVAEDEREERDEPEGRTRTYDAEDAAGDSERRDASGDEAGGGESEVVERGDGDLLSGPRSRPIVIAEAGANLVHRSFAYTDLRQPNLRSYETRPVLFAPHLHVEAYPLVPFMSGLAQGAGIELDYQFAIGLRSIDENDVAHPTSVNRFDLGARFNWFPNKEWDLMVAPLLGFRSATFAVEPAADGTELVGLPDIGYRALRVGAAAEFGIKQIVTFGRVELVPVLRLGEIGSDAFFPDSSGFALEARAGAGYRIMKDLEARFTLHYTRYGLSFRPAEGATYSASGAVDQYAGGELSVRYAY